MAVMRPPCDLLLVTWNKLEYTKPCVESILQHTTGPYRLIIVDNGSESDTIAFLDEMARLHPEKVVVRKQQENLGWCKAVNVGLRYSQAPYACMLNNDLIATPGWLEQMIAVAETDPLIGLVNPTYNQRGESLEAFQQRARDSAGDSPRYLEVNECNGACLLVKRCVVEAIGGLDEAYGSGGMDDSDYSRSAEVAGFRCARATQAFMFHWENVTYNSIPKYWSTTRRQNEAIFKERWGERTQLAVILNEHDDVSCQRILQQCLTLARLGLRLHIVGLVPRKSRLGTSAARWQAGIVEHNNLKWAVRTRWGSSFVSTLCLTWLIVMAAFRALGRRNKDSVHRIQVFVAPPGWLAIGLKWLRWLHGAPAYDCFEACPLIQRKLQWARALDSTLWRKDEALVLQGRS